jgi:hypothetical protein
MFAALPMVVVIALIVEGLKARKRAALLKATPTSNIGMAREGYGEFEGRVEAIAGTSIKAPLTGAPCVWYHAKVEKWIRRPRAAGYWSTQVESTSGTPFLLRDGTGACIVHPYGAEVTPMDRSQWYGATPTPQDRNPPRVDPSDVSPPAVEISGGTSHRYRYSEERIYDGNPLLVLGEFRPQGFAPEDEDEDDVNGEGDLDGDAMQDAQANTDRGERDPVDDEDDDDVRDLPSLEEDERLSERLEAAAQATTRATVSRGIGRQPFIMTTRLQAVHVVGAEMVSEAALPLALATAAVVAFLFWMRFG